MKSPKFLNMPHVGHILLGRKTDLRLLGVNVRFMEQPSRSERQRPSRRSGDSLSKLWYVRTFLPPAHMAVAFVVAKILVVEGFVR